MTFCLGPKTNGKLSYQNDSVVSCNDPTPHHIQYDFHTLAVPKLSLHRVVCKKCITEIRNF